MVIKNQQKRIAGQVFFITHRILSYLILEKSELFVRIIIQIIRLTGKWILAQKAVHDRKSDLSYGMIDSLSEL